MSVKVTKSRPNCRSVGRSASRTLGGASVSEARGKYSPPSAVRCREETSIVWLRNSRGRAALLPAVPVAPAAPAAPATLTALADAPAAPAPAAPAPLPLPGRRLGRRGALRSPSSAAGSAAATAGGVAGQGQGQGQGQWSVVRGRGRGWQHGRQVIDEECATKAKATHDGHELGRAGAELEDERQLAHLVRVRVRVGVGVSVRVRVRVGRQLAHLVGVR
eukprot:scaffold47933_cov64-Phaeocystis_antarctica.AAC.1